MKISVIIPTLNEQEYLGRLLDFLVQNNDPRLAEIIVVDGNSTDETYQIAREFGRKTSVPSQIVQMDKSSRTAQLQFGAKLAVGDLLYFVHADTLPPDTFLDDIEASINDGADLGSFRFRFESDRVVLKVNSWFTRFNTLSVRGGDQTVFVKKTSL